MAYCDVSDLKMYLNITNSKDDQLLTGLIDEAQAMMDEQIDRTFEASADTTRNFDAVADTDGQWLYLDEDLASITTITNGNGNTISSSQYVTEPRNETPYYAIKLLQSSDEVWEEDSTTGDAEDAIAIAGKWAYSETAPDDIKRACLTLSIWLYRRKDSIGNDADRPLITGDGVTILPARFPKDVEHILARYKKII